MKVIYIGVLLYCLNLSSLAQPFEIRGVLPWHNFLSGPSAWNEEDYKSYLDDCQDKGLNFIAFHNYTGGGERYFNYVEPMIKIAYKNVLPEASFDNGSTARWGYLPMKIKEFPLGAQKRFNLAVGEAYFGADCSTTAKTKEEHYDKAQMLMQKVLKMAHERNMEMAMGFEFGVAPPEYASIRTRNDMYWMGKGSLLYNPFDPDATGILYATIDNILETYEGIDWVYLWLNEHCMFGIDVKDALNNKLMADYYYKNESFYGDKDDSANESLKFLGVWSQAYIQKAYNYIKMKSPNTKVVIGGWGGEYQMASLLKGLNKTLPTDIVFSMLNNNQGESSHPDFFKEIARDRKIWAIPWLEGDASLWHLQPRVKSMQKQVKKAYKDQLDGVVAIHWRTEEIKLNFETFAHFASHPEDDEFTTIGCYRNYCRNELGVYAEKHLAPMLCMIDTTAVMSNIPSPVYFAYDPSWGRLSPKQIDICKKMKDKIDECIAHDNDKRHLANLNWLKSCYEFTLLLHQVGFALEPAWQLRDEHFANIGEHHFEKQRIVKAKELLEEAPVQEMIEVFGSRIKSRGELGEFASIIQRVSREYQHLVDFLESTKI